MNKSKYFLINGDEVIGIVYEDEKYGRTLVVLGKLDANRLLNIYEAGSGKKIADTDLLEFISSMIPTNIDKLA